MATEVEGSAEEPLNREPDIGSLISTFITPVDIEPYDRNHGAIPHIDDARHAVAVDGAVSKPRELTMAQLRNDFEHRTVIAAMQCAGNRRHTMRTELKEVEGIDWFDGAVMNCTWSGPMLCDVLRHVGIALEADIDWEKDEGAAHVQFASYQTPQQDDSWYGGSIPLRRAMDPRSGVLLAVQMNGQPLTQRHGFPVRVVVPGVAGARSVKWLDRITVALTESPNFYQKHDYKVLPPEATDMEAASKFWHSTPPIMDMPVNSVIGKPLSGATVSLDEQGCVEIKGYALPSGNGGPVVKVEVSGDGGESWVEAMLDWGGYADGHGVDALTLKWSWCLWSARVSLKGGSRRKIWSRATDAAGNTQPEKGQWTLRGVCYNGYGEAKDLELLETQNNASSNG